MLNWTAFLPPTDCCSAGCGDHRGSPIFILGLTVWGNCPQFGIQVQCVTIVSEVEGSEMTIMRGHRGDRVEESHQGIGSSHT